MKKDNLPKISFIALAILAVILLTVTIFLSQCQDKGTKRPASSALRWVSLGDSITDGGYWQPVVLEKYHFIHQEEGLSGSCVAGYNDILTPFWAPERLDPILASKPDLITIMGGTNDYFQGFALGSFKEVEKKLEDKDPTTFYGAYSTVIERIREALPDCQIVLMTPPQKYSQFLDNKANMSGFTMENFAQAVRELARHYEVPILDLHKEPYDEEGMAEDFWDGIHPNPEGAAKIGKGLIALLEENGYLE